jgi:hypothetical protein
LFTLFLEKIKKYKIHIFWNLIAFTYFWVITNDYFSWWMRSLEWKIWLDIHSNFLMATWTTYFSLIVFGFFKKRNVFFIVVNSMFILFFGFIISIYTLPFSRLGTGYDDSNVIGLLMNLISTIPGSLYEYFFTLLLCLSFSLVLVLFLKAIISLPILLLLLYKKLISHKS